jgi:hypothetical protein
MWLITHPPSYYPTLYDADSDVVMKWLTIPEQVSLRLQSRHSHRQAVGARCRSAKCILLVSWHCLASTNMYSRISSLAEGKATVSGDGESRLTNAISHKRESRLLRSFIFHRMKIFSEHVINGLCNVTAASLLAYNWVAWDYLELSMFTSIVLSFSMRSVWYQTKVSDQFFPVLDSYIIIFVILLYSTWLRRYVISRKAAGSSLDEVIEFLQFTWSFQAHYDPGIDWASKWVPENGLRGSERGQRVWLATSSPSVSRLSRQCGIINIFTLLYIFTLWRRNVLPVRYEPDCKYCYK